MEGRAAVEPTRCVRCGTSSTRLTHTHTHPSSASACVASTQSSTQRDTVIGLACDSGDADTRTCGQELCLAGLECSHRVVCQFPVKTNEPITQQKLLDRRCRSGRKEPVGNGNDRGAKGRKMEHTSVHARPGDSGACLGFEKSSIWEAMHALHETRHPTSRRQHATVAEMGPNNSTCKSC
jgi:hypothetical protein